MSQFRRRPQTPEQFVEQAEEIRRASTEVTETSVVVEDTVAEFPWDAPHMEEISKTFQLRLKMKHLLMLRYIAEHSPHNVSMQKFCIDTLVPGIEKRVEELTEG